MEAVWSGKHNIECISYLKYTKQNSSKQLEKSYYTYVRLIVKIIQLLAVNYCCKNFILVA